jgi:hypothetical protein
MTCLCRQRTPCALVGRHREAGGPVQLQSTDLAGEGGAQNMHDGRFSYRNDLGDHDV